MVQAGFHRVENFALSYRLSVPGLHWHRFLAFEKKQFHSWIGFAEGQNRETNFRPPPGDRNKEVGTGNKNKNKCINESTKRNREEYNEDRNAKNERKLTEMDKHLQESKKKAPH